VTEIFADSFEKLREEEYLISRGIRAVDGLPVLLLTPSFELPLSAGLVPLQRALTLCDHLDSSWAARPLELVEIRGRPALLTEDPGGEFLDGLIGRPLPIPEFLPLATGIAAALGGLHRQSLVHKDVKPANLIVKVGTGEAWLTGFFLASRQSRHRQSPEAPEVIVGTLAYMAPEQTGRMNRSIDSRSDLYSLGIVLYEMLVGALPFTASDPIEWVHCHIARRPVAPGERVDGIPEPISAIVMKLLAKAPEERYQTAAGVEADLRHCRAAWESRGQIEPFPLGAHDVSHQLLIPEKLYGRKKEIELLLAAFDRVVKKGTTELVLVSGYSGVGKSSAVNELHKVLVGPRALFASGKFDQYKRDIPYATLAQAFQKLVRQILTQSDAEVLRWRKALLEALGPNGRLIVNLIPEIEVIIGNQPPVVELPPKDAQNRFQMVFRRVLSVFARPEHPLALFLDDLQWLDAATLDLLQYLITNAEVRHLLIIGAYRDNEVSPSHPLMRTLAEIGKAGAPMQQIALASLGLEAVTQLMADTLHCTWEHAFPLAQLVHVKTGGNPFFAIQFISTLEEEGLLAFSPAAGAWKWNIDYIRAKSFTENVVELMVEKLNRLAPGTQNALKHLACLGNRAPTATLGLVHQQTEESLHANLWEAIRLGLVSETGETYAFIHDRVQEAAYALIPEEELAAEHLRIGRLLASQTAGAEIEKNVFDIVNQLNRGAALITLPEERERVAELNLIAGKRAKTSTAYVSALSYLSSGNAFLTGESWERRHGLTSELKFQLATCELLNAHFAAAEQTIAELVERASSKAAKASAYRLKVELHVLRSENPRAVEAALECLEIFGIRMSPHPHRSELDSAYAEVWRKLDGRPIESLVDLPLVTDPDVEAAMSVLSVLFAPAVFTDETLAWLHLCKMVTLTLEYGITDASTNAFGWFGILLGHVFGRYADGYAFGQLARSVVERHQFTAYEAKTLFSLELVSVWTRPITCAVDSIRAAFLAGVESGDVTITCYACNHTISDMLVRGDPLDEVWEETEHGIAFARRANFRDVVDIIVAQQRFIQNMRGRTATFSTFDEEGFDQESFEASLTPDRMATMVCWYWIIKGQARFISGDFEEAANAFTRAKSLLWASPGHIQNLDYHFFSALTSAALGSDGVSDFTSIEWREEIKAHREQLARWEESCPTTFADKHVLVNAELARIDGRALDAERLYDQAIRLARQSGFIQNEAIANEVTARFYLDREAEGTARRYLRAARSCYERWGALGKVQQIDLLYPNLRNEQLSAFPHLTGDPRGRHLDLATVVKMSQAVSEEIILDRLIERLLVIAVEHAGAVRGLLVRPDGAELRIEAEASTSREAITVSLRRELAMPGEFPESICRYVMRTHESVILDEGMKPNVFSTDQYIQEKRPRSVLCLPLVKQARLIGVLYLENNLASHVFTPPRIAVLQLLASQAAISLENARLYTEVQQAEERAKQREREFRLAVDMMPALAWKTLADGSIETFNKQWHDYTGISAEAALGGGWAASFHPDDRERVIETWRRNLACGASSEMEARMRRFDGEYRWFLLRASPLLDESGNILKWYGTNSDIDDLKRAEALLAGEKRLFEMIATGQTLPAILDALCRIVEELNGGSPASILLLDREGKRLRNGGAPNLPESYTRAIDGIRIGPAAGSCGTAAYRGEKVFVSDIATEPLWADYRALALEHDLRACWSTPILSAAGAVLGTIAVYSRQARPITPRENTIIEHFTHLASIAVERKRAEDALKKSEAFLAEGQRISHTGSWAWNLATDQVFWSEEHCRIFGYRPDEVGGTFASVLDRMLPEDRLRVEVPIAEAVRMGRDYSVEYRIVLPDGSIKYNQTVGRAIANESGEVTEYIGTTVDITERKRAEEELRRTEAGLRKAQSELAHVTRVTTMGELAASIAHEVNQPIAGVVLNGNACLRWLARVKEDSVNLVEAREAVERIIRDGRRAGEVVSRIRALFKKAETTKTPLELNEVVREVVVLARSEMDKKRVILRLKLAPELPRVPGDRVQLQQVLLNLILNGIEAMGRVENRPRELILGTQVNVEGQVLVTVRDSGTGLDPEGLEQAFTAFHTTKPGGLGMGLSISRSIIENHAGRLWATTNEGPGMTFQFTLSTDLPNLVAIHHE
jgi:PAS domain S-box-containing protein